MTRPQRTVIEENLKLLKVLPEFNQSEFCKKALEMVGNFNKKNTPFYSDNILDITIRKFPNPSHYQQIELLRLFNKIGLNQGAFTQKTHQGFVTKAISSFNEIKFHNIASASMSIEAILHLRNLGLLQKCKNEALSLLQKVVKSGLVSKFNDVTKNSLLEVFVYFDKVLKSRILYKKYLETQIADHVKKQDKGELTMSYSQNKICKSIIEMLGGSIEYDMREIKPGEVYELNTVDRLDEENSNIGIIFEAPYCEIDGQNVKSVDIEIRDLKTQKPIARIEVDGPSHFANFLNNAKDKKPQLRSTGKTQARDEIHQAIINGDTKYFAVDINGKIVATRKDLVEELQFLKDYQAKPELVAQSFPDVVIGQELVDEGFEERTPQDLQDQLFLSLENLKTDHDFEEFTRIFSELVRISPEGFDISKIEKGSQNLMDLVVEKIFDGSKDQDLVKALENVIYFLRVEVAAFFDYKPKKSNEKIASLFKKQEVGTKAKKAKKAKKNNFANWVVDKYEEGVLSEKKANDLFKKAFSLSADEFSRVFSASIKFGHKATFFAATNFFLTYRSNGNDSRSPMQNNIPYYGHIEELLAADDVDMLSLYLTTFEEIRSEVYKKFSNTLKLYGNYARPFDNFNIITMAANNNFGNNCYKYLLEKYFSFEPKERESRNFGLSLGKIFCRCSAERVSEFLNKMRIYELDLKFLSNIFNPDTVSTIDDLGVKLEIILTNDDFKKIETKTKKHFVENTMTLITQDLVKYEKLLETFVDNVDLNVSASDEFLEKLKKARKITLKTSDLSLRKCLGCILLNTTSLEEKGIAMSCLAKLAQQEDAVIKEQPRTKIEPMNDGIEKFMVKHYKEDPGAQH